MNAPSSMTLRLMMFFTELQEQIDWIHLCFQFQSEQIHKDAGEQINRPLTSESGCGRRGTRVSGSARCSCCGKLRCGETQRTHVVCERDTEKRLWTWRDTFIVSGTKCKSWVSSSLNWFLSGNMKTELNFFPHFRLKQTLCSSCLSSLSCE